MNFLLNNRVTWRIFVSVLLATVFAGCSQEQSEGRASSGSDRISSVSSDLYLGKGLVVTSTDIYSTDFRSGVRSKGLELLLSKGIPLVPGLSEATRTFEYSVVHVHDDEKIPISAPNSEHYLVPGTKDAFTVRIGSDHEQRPPGPVTYRIQFEISGIATRNSSRTEILAPLIAPLWSIPIERVTARFHLMRDVDPNSITYKVIRTRKEPGKIEGVIEAGASISIEFPAKGAALPSLLVNALTPVGPNEGLYLYASWPS